MTAYLHKSSLSIAQHRTSVALEHEFSTALAEQAAARGETLASLVTRVDGARDPSHPLASALRIEALRFATGVKGS